jgi:hypothetical protein
MDMAREAMVRAFAHTSRNTQILNEREQGKQSVKSEFSVHSVASCSKTMGSDASYICGACGEEIVIPIDVSQGDRQEFVEDCPVCCRTNVIIVEIDADGEARAWAELE